ncbi:prepilin peptidase [Leisingera sp. S132]|uniref:prepilin peptidase n=1 Tax=Leisingera sp. S132 TaxID=2867016 RepID=UPI0021A749FF|nr:prepilin peptidase [Leisingera sp. S132]UWQ79807.1 prepilin peptidase [Leisingera sp. S132]
MTAGADLLPLAAATPVLILAATGDLRHLRISNRLMLGLAAVFLLTAPLLPLAETGLRLLAASIVFALCFALFCGRVLAGGDVKMMALAMLFVPSSALAAFGWSFSAAMLTVPLALTVLGRIEAAAAWRHWASLQTPGKMPMGAAISLALMLLLIVLAAKA